MPAKESLEALAKDLPAGPAKEMVEGLIADPYPAATAALMIAMQMGAAADWDSGADYLDWIAEELGWAAPLHHPGNDANNALYRQLADVAGMDYKTEEEDE